MFLFVGILLKYVIVSSLLIFLLWLSIIEIRYTNKECSNIQINRSMKINVSISSLRIDSRLKLNHLTIVGTHNSYHKSNLIYKYEHRLLDKQFDYGIRQIELDIHLMKNNLVIYHLQLFDDQTNCYCFKYCLVLIQKWLNDNPSHYPIYLFIEIKQMFYEDLITGLTGGVKCQHFDQIKSELFDVFSLDQFIFPKEIQGNETSIRLSLKRQRQDELSNDYSYKNYGWPPVSSSLGKLIPVFLDDVHQIAQNLYFKCSSLQNYFLICQTKINLPYSSIITISNINQNIRKLIEIGNNGQISRLLLSYGSKNLDENYQSSKQYGIHIISSDSLYCDQTSLCQTLKTDFENSTIICNSYFAPSFCNSSFSLL